MRRAGAVDKSRRLHREAGVLRRRRPRHRSPLQRIRLPLQLLNSRVQLRRCDRLRGTARQRQQRLPHLETQLTEMLYSKLRRNLENNEP